MNFIQKNFKSLLLAGLITAFVSCNSNTEKKEDPLTKIDTTVTVTATPPAAFIPFDVLEITHAVKDYSVWRPLFNSDSTARKASGMEVIVVGRGADKNNNIMVALKVSDVQKAKDFAADPRLKTVMEKGGVLSKPNIDFFHVIRFNADSKEKRWVAVTHKVKNFDAWVKVFDEEGTATRAANGLVDVVLARGIDDPNIVHLVFDITDMAKAKARMNSPEVKKIMMDAGVETAPKIEYYISAD
jgi:quinol monooxygenase YgiN